VVLGDNGKKTIVIIVGSLEKARLAKNFDDYRVVIVSSLVNFASNC
jgi:hypothetical protein